MAKRLVCLAIALVTIAALFAGCGSSSTTTSQDTSSSAQQQSAVQTKADPNAEAFTITVSSWNLADEPLGIIKGYREAFEKVYKAKYPNATIQYNNTPGDKYFDVLKAQMASGSASDVIQFQNPQLGLFAKAGYIADLSDMPFAANIDGVAKASSSYKGKVYAAPFDINANGVWYSKKLFTDNNITLPKTWDDFLKICDTFKAKGITPIAGGFKDYWVANMTVGVFTPNDYGSNTFEVDIYNGTKKLNGPEIQTTFNKLQTLVDKGYFGPDALSNGWDLQRKAFEDGKAAMIIHGSYIAGLCNSEMKEKGGMETGFFALPNDKGDPVLGMSVGTLTGVNAKTKDLQRAKDLVMAMHDQNAQVVRDKDAGVFPAMKGITIDYKEAGNKDFLNVIGATKGIMAGYNLPSSVSDIFGQSLQKMLAGKKFDPAWLDAADKAFAKDKALVPVPEQ